MTGRFRVALRSQRQQVFGSEFSTLIGRGLVGAQADHIRFAGRRDCQHNTARKQQRYNAANNLRGSPSSSPSISVILSRQQRTRRWRSLPVLIGF
jgi:hypothetical protein